MNYRRLGRSGLKISSLALGTLNFGSPTRKEEAFKMIDRAIEAGINLINSADVYSDLIFRMGYLSIRNILISL